ncbi:MAG TPA: PPC domain-containing protein [Chthoniobacteraceae bacterium]|jgi:hypothetical protein|nr:PPC domain-containing protein [Chthoniobacteraceae bacterium]
MLRVSATVAALWIGLCAVARAASPHLDSIDPPGIQRGVDTEVVFSGDRLQDARGILYYSPGIETASLQVDGGGRVHAKLRAAPDCPLGEHEVRVWTAGGISDLMPLYVSPYPNVQSSGTCHDIAHAQPVAVNSTVNGIIHDEQIDYYAIQAKKGDRISAEVEGMRLGRDMFDPWTGIFDAQKRQIAADDDNTLYIQDPVVSTVAPADGPYYVAVRESTWGGSARSVYRLHIGNFPQPTAVYPGGGPAGQSLPVTFLGDAKGPISATLPLPAEGHFGGVAVDGGLSAPGVLPMRVSAFPNVLQQAPDADIAHATASNSPPPLAFNGIVRQPGERDFYKFHAKRGTVLDITVYARQLGSPLDSVLDVWNAKGGHLAENDDSIGLDSYLRWNVPADGDYCVSVRDHLHSGGPNYVYRVEVVPVGPSVIFTEPEVVRDSQERQTIVVPRGNRYATMLRVKRESIDGDFQVAMPALLPGVTLQTGSMAGEMMPVIFQAKPDAAVSATVTDVVAKSGTAGQPVAGGYAQTVELVHGPPNNYPYLKTDIDRLAISVADDAPFQVDVATPPVAILEDGQMALKITATRKAGFTGPINVSMLYNPPGLNSQPVVTIPANQTSVDLPLNANGDAKAKTWQIAVIASADAGKGTVWVSSGLVPLTVARPFITAQIDRAAAVQGQPVSVICHLSQNVPFTGKAHLQLMGLPAKCAATDLDVAPADQQAVFKVTTDATSPQGQHRDLFCQVTVEQNGVKMTANTAYGGDLRIDRLPPPPKAPKPTKPPPVALKNPAPAAQPSPPRQIASQ